MHLRKGMPQGKGKRTGMSAEERCDFQRKSVTARSAGRSAWCESELGRDQLASSVLVLFEASQSRGDGRARPPTPSPASSPLAARSPRRTFPDDGDSRQHAAEGPAATVMRSSYAPARRRWHAHRTRVHMHDAPSNPHPPFPRLPPRHPHICAVPRLSLAGASPASRSRTRTRRGARIGWSHRHHPIVADSKTTSRP